MAFAYKLELGQSRLSVTQTLVGEGRLSSEDREGQAHDLRHTHATLALQAGVHPKVVSERLGHSTVSITLDIYSHAIPALQESAAELVASLVFSAATEAAPLNR